MKRTLTLSLGALLLLVGASAFAAGAGGHWKAAGPGGSAAMMQRHDAFLAKTLSLTDEQKAAVQKIHQDLAVQAQPLQAQHHQQMQEIYSLLKGGNADATEIGQKMIDSYATGQQLKALHSDFNTKFSALLTPDQLTKFQQIQAAHPRTGRLPAEN